MTAFLLDLVYLAALLVASPWLVYRAVRSCKYRAGLVQKLWGAVPYRTSLRPAVWFHAVSVGEVLLLRKLVPALVRARPDLEIVISTTTHTGMEVARQHFPGHVLCYFPLDFSWAVARALRRLRPDVVALVELELWPNFIAAARRSGARLALVNGRMSPQSYRRYRRARWLMRSLLAQFDRCGVQTQDYADWFRHLGAPPRDTVVTGSVKYDGIETGRDNPATAKLRQLFALEPHELVWVAGSTSEPEEEIVLDAYARLRAEHSNLRLILVPRHQERFDDVARLVTSRGFTLLRRSQAGGPRSEGRGQRSEVSGQKAEIRGQKVSDDSICNLQSAICNEGRSICHLPSAICHPIVLVDTLGELSAVWGLADVAFVGGSFAPRGGQNMIEPAGYGAAVLFGPGTWNFKDTVTHLLARGGALEVSRPQELAGVVARLAGDARERARLGAAARSFVLSQQGATARTVELLRTLLDPPAGQAREAA